MFRPRVGTKAAGSSEVTLSGWPEGNATKRELIRINRKKRNRKRNQTLHMGVKTTLVTVMASSQLTRIMRQ